MDQMKIRKMHRRLGICLAFFFALTAICGFILLFRNEGILSEQTTYLIKSIHNYEIIYKFVGSLVAIGLLGMAISGSILYFKVRAALRKNKAR